MYVQFECFHTSVWCVVRMFEPPSLCIYIYTSIYMSIAYVWVIVDGGDRGPRERLRDSIKGHLWAVCIAHILCDARRCISRVLRIRNTFYVFAISICMWCWTLIVVWNYIRIQVYILLGGDIAVCLRVNRPSCEYMLSSWDFICNSESAHSNAQSGCAIVASSAISHSAWVAIWRTINPGLQWSTHKSCPRILHMISRLTRPLFPWFVFDFDHESLLISNNWKTKMSDIPKDIWSY